MAELNRIAEIIEKLAPLETQEPWDNSGWQIHLNCEPVRKVLVALELNQAVAEEAVKEQVQLIVCHHPLIFGGIRKIDRNDVTGNILLQLISAGISVYATHTPFDKCAGGNNDYLTQLLELSEVHPIPGDETGICRMGRLAEAETVQSVLEKFSRKTGQNLQNYRLVGSPVHLVDTVGVCTGAGAEFISLAAEAGCGLYITGDVKYHEAQHALETGMTVADMGHFGSEDIFKENMVQILRRAVGDSPEIIGSQVNLNPFTVLKQGEM